MDGKEGVSVAIRDHPDAVIAKVEARMMAERVGFEEIDQSRIAAAVFELATNIIQHAQCGEMRGNFIHDGQRQGLEFVFNDRGPGIPDPEAALRGKNTGGTRPRLGLAAAQALVDEFELESAVGHGTKVTIRKWIRR